jgi:tetratricopeptide (TPR) repeat protein
MPYLIGFVVVLIVGSAAFLAYKAYQKSKSPTASRRKLDLAMMQLGQEIRRNPNNAAAFSKRGIIRQKKGDLPGALADLERALALDPSLTEARYHHGAALEQKGDLAGAEKEFDWIMTFSEDLFYKTAVKDRLAQVRSRRKFG